MDSFYAAPVVLRMLAAHEKGLGSCWIHRAKERIEALIELGFDKTEEVLISFYSPCIPYKNMLKFKSYDKNKGRI